MAHVNELQPLAPGTEPDHTVWKTANAFHRKSCHGRYALAYIRGVLPALRDWYTEGCDGTFTVLDAPTGEGRGAAYIAEQLGGRPGVRVHAVDINPASYRAPGVAYHIDDLLAFLDAQGPYNCIVCLEFLEHVDEHYGREAVQAIYDTLAPGGRAVFSSPRRRPRESTVGRSHHIHEYWDQEFHYLIEEFFPITERWSFDRYANATPYNTDANLMVCIGTKLPHTEVFS